MYSGFTYCGNTCRGGISSGDSHGGSGGRSVKGMGQRLCIGKVGPFKPIGFVSFTATLCVPTIR